MLTQIVNKHHSKLPQVGAIGYITNGTNRWGERLFWKGVRQRWQCVAYPLNDNAWTWGIHTAFFKNLGTGEVRRFSGFYFDEDGGPVKIKKPYQTRVVRFATA